MTPSQECEESAAMTAPGLANRDPLESADRKQILHIAETQGESGIQPDRMAEDFGREAATLE